MTVPRVSGVVITARGVCAGTSPRNFSVSCGSYPREPGQLGLGWVPGVCVVGIPQATLISSGQ